MKTVGREGEEIVRVDNGLIRKNNLGAKNRGHKRPSSLPKAIDVYLVYYTECRLQRP